MCGAGNAKRQRDVLFCNVLASSGLVDLRSGSKKDIPRTAGGIGGASTKCVVDLRCVINIVQLEIMKHILTFCVISYENPLLT